MRRDLLDKPIKSISKMDKIDFEILGYRIGRYEDWIYIDILYRIGSDKKAKPLHGFSINDTANHIETLLKNEKKIADKILDAIYEDVKPWLINPANFWIIHDEVIRAIKTLYDKWLEFKVKEYGLGVEEIHRILPPKTRIFIEKELGTIYSKKFIAYVKGTTRVFYPKNPAEAIAYSCRIRSGDIGAKKLFGDLGPEAIIQEDPVPYLHIYKLRGGIGLAYTSIGYGVREVRLLPITLTDLDRLKEELGPEYDHLLSIIYKTYRIKEGGEGIKKVFHNIYWLETGLTRDLVNQLLREYNEYIEIFKHIEGIDWLIEYYKAMILPWFNPYYSPHALIVSPTNTGKTILYRLMTGEDPYTDITPVSLVGGIDPGTKKPLLGILHGRIKALQIERLEAKTSGETLSLLIDYMKSGVAKRGVGIRTIEARGSAPIIFTGNPVGTGRALKIQDWLNLGLLKNPEALGSRLLLFYTEERRELRIPKDIDKIEVIREIGYSSFIIKRLRKIWSHPRVETWLFDKEILYINEIDKTEVIGDLYHYIKVLVREFAPRLKALALNNILVDHLDDLDNLDEILDKANAKYEFFKQQLLNSIVNVLAEYKIINPTTLALNLPKLLIKMIISINKYINDNMIFQERVVIPLKNIMDTMKKLGFRLTLKHRLKQYISKYERELKHLGIIYSVDKELVIVDTTLLNQIDFEELQRETQ